MLTTDCEMPKVLFLSLALLLFCSPFGTNPFLRYSSKAAVVHMRNCPLSGSGHDSCRRWSYRGCRNPSRLRPYRKCHGLRRMQILHTSCLWWVRHRRKYVWCGDWWSNDCAETALPIIFRKMDCQNYKGDKNNSVYTDDEISVHWRRNQSTLTKNSVYTDFILPPL